mmetsp:Transcript_67582/g.150855  ORF Transcript_67582/g.150855 Transcript_67582/m.150855 type:complete len:142 (+) Transcript_67582:3-428(+)
MFTQVSTLLKMPLVLTASDTDLWNVDLAALGESCDASDAMDRFRPFVSMTGTRSERGFHALPFAVQHALTPLLPVLLDAPRCVRCGENAALIKLCKDTAAALRVVTGLLQRVYTEVDREEFYDVYRPVTSQNRDQTVTVPI